ncbi:hypothetical protein Q8G47_28795, partial [Klebsiella pneumoniae]|uniref:hypothetical protein n=1 Tax=Klebsiella pneumoniae TaxID=573 RepID=UPI0030133A6C
EVARQPEAVVAGDNTSAADAGIVIAEELVVDIEMVGVVGVVVVADVETIADVVAGIEKDPLEAGQLMAQVASFVQTLEFGRERKESG